MHHLLKWYKSIIAQRASSLVTRAWKPNWISGRLVEDVNRSRYRQVLNSLVAESWLALSPILVLRVYLCLWRVEVFPPEEGREWMDVGLAGDNQQQREACQTRRRDDSHPHPHPHPHSQTQRHAYIHTPFIAKGGISMHQQSIFPYSTYIPPSLLSLPATCTRILFLYTYQQCL